jgi:HlyD family secretion protein
MLHKHPTLYVAIAGLTVMGILVARLNSKPAIPPPPFEPPAKPYDISVAASGIVEAMSDNIAIGVPAAGLVAKVHVQVWDRVEAGQPLFTLDGREIVAQLGVNEASAAVALATVERLQDQLNRLKGVNDPRAVSQDEVRTRENDVAVAQAQHAMARAQVTQSRVCLERLTVLAPRDGTILQVNVRAGEYASATPKNAAIVLGDMDHLQVRADIDEQNASRLQPGQTATAYLKGDNANPITLRFVRIEPIVIPKVSLTGASTERVDTRVLQVIYAFERPEDRPIYVGQQVDLFVRTEAPAIAINEASKSSQVKGPL